MLAAFVLCLAQSSPGPEPKVYESEHFELRAEWGDAEQVELALEIAEAAWVETTSVLGVPEWELHEKLTLALVEGQDRADNEAGPSRDWPDCWNGRVVLSMTVKIELASKTAALVLHRLLPTVRDIPEWFLHGLCDHVAVESLKALEMSQEPGLEPMFSTQRWWAKQALKRRDRITLADYFTGDLESHIPDYLLKPLRGHGFRSLVKDPDRFATLSKALWQIPGGVDFAPGVEGALRSIYGPEFWEDSLDRLALLEHTWVVRSGDLSTIEKGWLQLGDSQSRAMAWRTDQRLDLPFVIEGEFEILNEGSSKSSVVLGSAFGDGLFGMEPDDFLAIQFRTGEGVTLSRGSNYKLLGSKSVPVRRGVPQRFSIEVDGETLRVSVEDSREVEFRMPRFKIQQWGLSTQTDSATFWRNVRVH